MTKTCFKCKRELPVDEFYRHPRMADGRLGKCKECTKRDVQANRLENVEHYRAYDRERFANDPDRRAASRLNSRRMYSEHREQYKARTALSNAIRDGRLKRRPCIVCGNPKSEGHHEDYSKPLDVIWLCRRHHFEWHFPRYATFDKETIMKQREAA